MLLAHRLAIASPRIRADAIEVTEFPELAQRYQVMGVPKTVLNETTEFVGAMPEDAVVAFVERAGGAGG